MTRQAYLGSDPRFLSLAVLSAVGLLACASPSTTTGNTGGTTGSGTGGAQSTGGTTGARRHPHGRIDRHGRQRLDGRHDRHRRHPHGRNDRHGRQGTGTGGNGTGTGGNGTGTGGNGTGTGGNGTGTGGSTGTGGMAGKAGTGGSAGGSNGCANTDTSTINMDSSGYICGNQWGIKGAWYCYSNDTSEHPARRTAGPAPFRTTRRPRECA